jgi:hypothetical protein
MSQAEELLNSVSEEVPVHAHPVPDTDTYFVIDPVTRQIENMSPKKNVIMQYDHNSERFTFELPRYIDGHDMLECTSVTVNVDNIEVVESDGVEEIEPRVNSDAPDITDLRVHPADSEKVICSWLISRNSTQLAGILSFHVEFKCVDSSGNVVYEWSTDNFDGIEVRARKKNGEAAVAPHADLLEQWRTRIFGAGDSVMANIAAEGEAQVAAVKAESETQQEAVELKGAQTLDSIPEDYTEVGTMAEEAVRSKGSAIICEAAGEYIVLKDSSNDHIRGLKLFGKSIQGDIPTPDNPVEIASIENPMVSVGGKNLVHSVYNQYIPLSLRGGTILTASCDNPVSDQMNILFYDEQKNRVESYKMVNTAENGRSYVTFTLSHDVEYAMFAWATVETIINAQVTFGVSTDYEPCKTAQSNTINHTLHGIPVTSGGNYTDENGQQWICDEIDLERGVYVQRVGIKDFDGSDDEDWGGVSEVTDTMRSWITVQGAYRPESDTTNGIMCSQFNPQVSMNKGAFYQNRDRFFFGSGMTLNAWKTHLQSKPLQLVYILSTPIETPLTSEEIMAFKALRTNYPNTTILNDAGAWMSVKYNADTKTYIENPRVLKLVDSSTGVVYELKIVNGSLTVNPIA